MTPTLVVAGVQARAIEAGTTQIMEALTRFAQIRSATIIATLNTQLSETFVHRTPEEISKLLAREAAREREFLRRQATRIRRDLPKILAEADTEARKAAMRKLLTREQRYMGQRERAMTARAHSLVESLDLQDRSPEGAMWLLGGPVHQHTPGCLAMANKFWPWPVLREVIHPPVHPGCPCHLIGLNEAVAAGLMDADQIPDTQDALLRARRNAALEEALYETYPEWMIRDEMLSLEEVSEPGHNPVSRRGESAHAPVLRYAKGLIKGGQFMPKLGGSSARTKVRKLIGHRKPPKGIAGRNLGRSVWMNGNHVHVPEARRFERKIGAHTFTSPPGSTNVYRNGKLVSTPDHPHMHASTQRPRAGDERGKVTRKGTTPEPVLSAEDRRKQSAGRRVESAIRTAKPDAKPVRQGQSAHDAHAALRQAGFTAKETNAGNADSLVVAYSHKDGHELTVTYDRKTSKVQSAEWKAGEPSKTDALRRKLGHEEPKAKESAKPTPAKPEKAAQTPERPRTPQVDRTLGTHDPVWGRQLDRADAGDGNAQWDLAAEVAARGPNSEFAQKLREVVGSDKLRRWQRGSSWPGRVPKGEAPPRYEVKHVDAEDHGPSVGVALHADVAGGLGDHRSLGTGRYFTSGRRGERGTSGLDLSGAHLHRPADSESSRSLHHGLSILNAIADDSGTTTTMLDPATGEARQLGIEDVLSRLPDGIDPAHAQLMAEHALDMHRAPNADEAAATHLMRGLGYDGVDNRHLPDLDVPEVGSVVYAPQGVENADQATPASPGQGGAVVRGVLGRWVWIRGHYTHIPQDTAWTHTEDGIRFHSPAGGTGVYRSAPNESDELVSAPGMRARHADVRNPRSSSTSRGRTATPRPTPEPRPQPIDGEGDPTPEPTPEAIPEPIPAAPDGVGMVLTDEGRRALLAGEHVAGITHSETQLEAVNGTGLPEGNLVTGGPWTRMTGEERQNALDTTYGRALAHAIGSEATSREELGGLWTGGKFTDDQGNHLDRYDANVAVAKAYATMNGEGWRDFAAQYPDVARFVMTQAAQRNYHVRPDVAEWLVAPDTGSNVHDPVGELTGDAREFAASLEGTSVRAARQRLSENGWLLNTTGGSNGVTSVWRKVDNEARQVQTLALTSENGPGGFVTSARGTVHGFVGDQVPPEGNTPERVAYELRNMTVGNAATKLGEQGWLTMGNTYSGIGSSTSLWIHPDQPQLGIHLQHRTHMDPNSRGTVALVEDAQPTVLDAAEDVARARTITRIRPDLGIREGTLADDMPEILRGTQWRQEATQQTQRDKAWFDITHVLNRDDPERIEYDGYRVQMEMRDGRFVVTKVGRPAVQDGQLATDDAAWRDARAAAEAGLRETAQERNTRIAGAAEHIRTSVNSGDAPSNIAGMSQGEADAALRAAGYREGAGRTLQNGARSITYANPQTGSRMSVRYSEGQVQSVRLLTQGATDEGRVRTPEGEMPSTIAKVEADLKGWSDELAHRFGTTSEVIGIRWGGRNAASDHQGVRGWDGVIGLGPAVRRDMEVLQRAREDGRALTESEKSSAISAYRTMAHEVIHGVGGLRTQDYRDDNGTVGIEEAITSELEVEFAYELMRRHGNNDLLDFARSGNRLATRVGGYQVHRQNFRTVMQEAGLGDLSNGQKRELFHEWSFSSPPTARLGELSRTMAEHRGISVDEARQRIESTMRGPNSRGSGLVTQFQPILRTIVPEPLPTATPEPADRALHEVGARVTWRGSNAHTGGENPGAGVIIGRNYTTTGWRYTVTGDDGTAREFQQSLLSAEQAQPEPTPTGRSVPTSPLHDGGKVGIGARVWGVHSGMLGTVLSVNGDQITVRRDNGTEGTFDGRSFDSVAITNTGEAIRRGSEAWSPVAGESARSGELMGVDWSDPANPMARLRVGGTSIVVPARTLTSGNPDNGGGWQLPLARRDGRADHATVGTRVLTTNGEEITLTGQSISSWPIGQLIYTGTRADGTSITTPREGITGFAGELPRPGRTPQVEAELGRELAQMHYERRDGSVAATALGRYLASRAALVNTPAGSGFEQWLRAEGVDLNGRTGAQIIEQMYADGFQSRTRQEVTEASFPREYAGVMQMAREAGLPTPDWVNQVRPGGVVVPDGDMTNENVLRALYTGTFGSAGHTSQVNNVSANTDGATITGSVLDAQGNHVGQFSRRVTRNPDGSYGVYNALLQLNSSAQGTGFASAFNRHCFEQYRQKGVREVTVSANLDVGGYTWAATGFDFNIRGETDPQRIAEGRAGMARSFVEQGLSYGRITRAEYDSIKDRIWSGVGPLEDHHVQHAWELAHIDGRPAGRRRGPKNIGQKLLLDQSWPGIRLMDAPDPRPQGSSPTPTPTPRPTPRPTARTRARIEAEERATRHLNFTAANFPTPFRQTIADFGEAIDQLHPNLPVERPNVLRQSLRRLGAGTRGAYARGGSRLIFSNSREAAEGRDLTMAHEYGHHIDYEILQGLNEGDRGHAELMDVYRAVEATGMADRVQDWLQDAGSRYQNRVHAQYLLSQKEVWARAYARWVAARASNPRLTEQALGLDGRPGHWTAEEFESVGRAIDRLMAVIAQPV